MYYNHATIFCMFYDDRNNEEKKRVKNAEKILSKMQRMEKEGKNKY